MELNRTILFFDSQCLMCNKFIQFVFNKDNLKILYYSDLCSEIAKYHSIDKELKSFVLLYEGEYFIRSKAFIKLLTIINFSPSILVLLKLIPTFILDWIYQLIANNRYMFGNSNQCHLEIKKYQLT